MKVENIILKYIKDGNRVMEIGCGNGNIINMLSSNSVKLDKIVAIDRLRPKNINKNVEFFEGDIENFQTKEKFDLVILKHVLEHIKDPIGLLEKIKQMLNDYGKILIVVPNRYGYENEAKVYLPEHGKHYFLWDRESLQFTLEKLSFACRFHNQFVELDNNIFIRILPKLFRVQNSEIVCVAMVGKQKIDNEKQI
ncbi:class I SAM-dependent methyltransferase [Patescibacteria group bacterium]|nr:class I SAM-dependent methyltransferase [Patescibacteria group bacterium]